MVPGRVKAAMGFQRSFATPKSGASSAHKAAAASAALQPLPGPAQQQAVETPRRRSSGSPAPPASAGPRRGSGAFARSFGAYFPRSSAQVQPPRAATTPEVGELTRLVEELQERESHLRTDLLEHKILKETVVIVPFLETELAAKSSELGRCRDTMPRLEAENARLRAELDAAVASARSKEQRILEMEKQMSEPRKRQREASTGPDDCSSSASSDNSGSSNAGSSSAKPATKSVLPPSSPPPPPQQHGPAWRRGHGPERSSWSAPATVTCVTVAARARGPASRVGGATESVAGGGRDAHHAAFAQTVVGLYPAM